MQYIVFIFFLSASLWHFWLAYKLIVRHNITLLHEYHYKNVATDDIATYTTLVGIAMLLNGLGFMLTAVFFLYIRSTFVYILLCIFILSSLCIQHKAQRKYNKTWF